MADTEYISKEAALACFSDWIDRYGHEHSADEMTEYQRIEDLPVADVRPMVRAHWEWDENGIDWGLGVWKCSHCHCKAETWWATKKSSPLHCAGSHFCGNCGADMR